MIRLWIATHMLAFWMKRREMRLAQYNASCKAVKKWDAIVAQSIFDEGGFT